MYSLLKTTAVRLLMGVALLTPVAQAQLLLSGKVTGSFTDVPGPNTTIVNALDGSSAVFKSGIPETASDKQTAIEFAQQNFTDIGPGLVASNLFTVTNGRTLLHSTAIAAHFDLWLTLTSPIGYTTLLTPIAFTIENTPNQPGNVDDAYTVTSAAIAPFKVQDTLVQFTFVAPELFTIHENQSTSLGDLYVSFTPVPEPSTYGVIGAVALLGFVGLRALRRRRASAVV